VSDSSQLSEAVKKALKENPDIAEKLRQGNMKPMGVIIGLVMKETHGQADAKSVKELIVQEVSK
ncbi:MAG: GatB/YqeY domain-containing protein, partial [Aeriscardovia sp.]|nr:GatB/YqeY domain-containing protein [Aeriscardovia sp.]